MFKHSNNKKGHKANLAFWAVFKTLINHENPYLFGYSSIIHCMQQITNMAKLLLVQFLKPEFSPDFWGARILVQKTHQFLGGTANRQGEGYQGELKKNALLLWPEKQGIREFSSP